jgi:hypothetical protein
MSAARQESYFRRWIFILSAVVTLSFLAVDSFFLSRSKTSTVRKVHLHNGRLALNLHRFVFPYHIRGGVAHFSSDQIIDRMEVLIPDAWGREIPVEARFRKVTPRHFKVVIAEEMSDWIVIFRPLSASVAAMKVTVTLVPSIRPDVYVLKAGLVFCVTLFLFSLALLLSIILRMVSLGLEVGVRLITAAFTGAAAILFIHVILHPASFLMIAARLNVRLWRLLLFNLAFAGMLTLFTAVFMRRRLSLFLWPLLLTLALFLVTPDFKTAVCGDAHQIMSQLNQNSMALSGSNPLSILLVKAIMAISRIFHLPSSASLAQALAGKIIGALSLFALALLISPEKFLSRKKKILFLAIASTFGINAFFLGFPEFAYYPLPFLILALAAANRYRQSERREILYLSLTAGLVIVAGLFHGSAFAVLPAVFVLPLLRGRERHPPGSIFISLVLRWTLIFGLAVALVLVAFGAARLLGFTLDFQSVLGGGDKSALVEFWPNRPSTVEATLVFELRYLWERGWAVLLAIPLPFLVLMACSFRRICGTAAGVFWLIGGSMQFLLFLLWNFDLGYMDFDLYLYPLTLLGFFLLKNALEVQNVGTSTRRDLALVAVFALASPVSLILELTAQPLF